MSLLTFPDSPSNGQIYPVIPLPNQTQYEWEAATDTWRIIRAGAVARLIAGPNITLSPPEGVGVVTISATGGGGGGTVTQVAGTLPIVISGTTAFPVVSLNPATTLSPGSMSAADKTKLDGLSNYTLPPATTTTLGGVIPDGTTISVSPSGAISVVNTSDWLLTGSNLAPVNRTDSVQVGGTNANPAINLAADGRIRTVQTGNVGNVSLAVGGQTYGLYNPDATSIAVSAGAVKKMQWDAVGVQLPGLANGTQRTLYLNTGGYVQALDGLPGTVTEVTADLPLEVEFADTTPNITVRSATTAARGVVQLNDTNTGEGIVNQAATSNQIWLLQQQFDALPPPYVLPPATTTTLGGVIPDGVTVLVGVDGTISAVGGGGGTVTNVTGTLPIVSTGGVTPAISINSATTTTAGSMSSADKTKLDGLSNYTLPPATTTTLGGVIPDGVTVLVGVDGTISAVGGGGGVVEVLAGVGGVFITGTPVSPRVNVTHPSYTFQTYDSVDSQFNGTETSFEMRVGGQSVTLETPTNIQVVLGGVMQIPGVSYTVTTGATTTVIFDVAPPTGASIYAYSIAPYTEPDFPPYDCRTNVNTYSVTNFANAWECCTELTSFPLIDTSSGTIFTSAWKFCNGLTSFPLLNTSKGTLFSGAWGSCEGLTSFPLLDTSSGDDFTGAWNYCTGLSEFPEINTSAGIFFARAWEGCFGLTSFPLLDVSSGTNFLSTWSGCSALESFPDLNTGSGILFNFAWDNCPSLTSFPLIDVSSGTSFLQTWYGCTSLTSFPPLNFNSGLFFPNTWESCTSLEDFPANMFDTCAATLFEYAWLNCALSQTSVDNILVSLDVAGNFNGIVHINLGTSSPPGPAGVAARASLVAKGWNVFTN
jgi:hypothetical protein